MISFPLPERRSVSLITTFLFLAAVVFELAVAGAQSSAADFSVVALRCEYAVEPLGVDLIHPRLYWQVQSSRRGQKQTAYQIQVATRSQLLEQGSADLWDTNQVSSDQTTQVEYFGKELISSQQVFWRVRSWDADGEPSAWSEIASWTMGILAKDDWQAQWIIAPWSSEALLLRKAFDVRPKLRRALAHVCGLGQFEMSVNGKKSGDHLLSPGWTKYNRTCLYETHDITELLKPGRNAIGIALGNGMYHTERRNRFSKFQGTFGPLRAYGQIELEYSDGTKEVVPTDTSWRVSRGPVTFNDIFGGEDFDARLVEANWDQTRFDDEQWTPAVLLVRPSGVLRGACSSAPPLRAIETIPPASKTEFGPSTEVIDFGQNTSIMPQIRVAGPAGSTIRLTHAEVVNQDGSINRRTCGGNRGPAYWQYTKRSDELETWFPQFFYVGCRYLQVDKLPAVEGGELPRLESCDAVVVHSSAQATGEFSTSNELINRIRTLVRWAQRSNMVSVLTDCPHREKLGWLEQYHLNGPAIRYEFDVNRIFTKSMRDMADSQLDSGLVPNIAPEYVKFPGTFRAAAEWGSAVILVPWQQYLFTGDKQLLEEYYESMQHYLDYLGDQSDELIVSEGLGDWYDLGPADRPGYAQLTPPPVTATAFYYLSARTMSDIAELLDKKEDSESYQTLAEKIRTAWLKEFRHEDGTYATDSQCSNAIALEMQLAEPADREKVLASLVRSIRENENATNAGDVGHRYVLQALANGGHSDLIYKMINQDERPGYGYQLKQGATSLTEAWDANHQASHNHFMLGHITEWFYNQLVGIQYDPAVPGFKHAIIAPTPVAGLEWAEGSYQSIHGPISVRWERKDGGFKLSVSIPCNTTATIRLPSKDSENVTAGGLSVGEGEGVRFLRQERDRTILEIESGRYQFQAEF